MNQNVHTEPEPESRKERLLKDQSRRFKCSELIKQKTLPWMRTGLSLDQFKLVGTRKTVRTDFQF